MVHSPWTLLIVASTAVISWISFSNAGLFRKLMLDSRAVIERGEAFRTLSSGWVHANFAHLAVNMFSLWSFGRILEAYYGPAAMLTPYLAGIVGGSLLAVFLHRRGDYHAVGASGGVCGAVFASVLLEPGSSVFVFPLPIPIPARIYTFIFLLLTWFGMRRGGDGIGHDAHFGGAIIGILVAVAMFPRAAVAQLPFLVLLLSVAAILGYDGYRRQRRREFGKWR